MYEVLEVRVGLREVWSEEVLVVAAVEGGYIISRVAQGAVVCGVEELYKVIASFAFSGSCRLYNYFEALKYYYRSVGHAYTYYIRKIAHN